MRNGYFQIGCTGGGTVVRLVKPVDGGNEVTAREIAEYLSGHGIVYDAGLLTKGIQNAASVANNEFLFLVNKDIIPEIRESYVLTIRPDKMIASVRFYPPSMKGERMTAQEFLMDLKVKGIVFGIKEKEIEAFFAKPRYCTDFIAAMGVPARNGCDARIKYFFNTDLHAEPALSEDGSVDFFHLNTICHCKKGEVLARLYPEDPGENGTTIYGEIVKPREVKRKHLEFGRNITLSPDRLQITSDVNGHVALVQDKVFVSDVLEVENVDTSTGDIEYEGSVLVNGNVLTNFSIKAQGHVEIRGVVEGACIESGGDIIIARGMNGMGRGVLATKGNVVAKYLENATVSAKGYVSTESILHSRVMAGTEINVTGRKGFITGGRVSAANVIRVKTLGSPMGADTIVEVGADPSVKLRIQELQKLVIEHKKSIEISHPVLTANMQKLRQGIKLKPDQMKYFQEMLQEENRRNQEIEQYLQEMESLQAILDASSNAKVEVSGEVFAGTKICIGDVSMVVKNSMKFCKFVKQQGDVKMTAL
mgnify:FL=1